MSWFSHGALRRIAVLTTLTTSWLTVGPSVGSAVANTRAKASQKGHQRVLTPLELARIHGARQEGPPLETGIVNPVDRDVDGQTGSTFAWEWTIPRKVSVKLGNRYLIASTKEPLVEVTP